jgi:flagellar biosynthesis protein FlhG
MSIDQAEKLRSLARHASNAPPRGVSMPLVALGGGQAGVGTSTIALQLATALSRRGHKSLLLEADLDRGGSVEQDGRVDTIADCLSGRRKLRDVCRRGPDEILVVPGAWAPGEMAVCTAPAQQRLLAELQSPMPDADVAVIDLGSSRSSFVRRFWQVASMIVVVATADPDCVRDAYGAIKVLHAGDTSIPVYTLLNFARPLGDPNAIHDRIGQTCRRFLGLRTSALGSMPRLDDLTSDEAGVAAENLAGALALELGLVADRSRALAA